MKYLDVKCNTCGSNRKETIASGTDFEYFCTDEVFTMVRCLECGLIYLDPRPAPQELSIIYPDNYIAYRFDDYLPPLVNKIRILIQKRKVRAVARLCNEQAEIWDVGCGGGFFLECLRELGPETWTLKGVDISAKALNRVQERGFETLQGRFEGMDLTPESVDLIVLNQVIEHLDDPAAVVKKAYQALKPGGHLFIETPSVEGWDARIFLERYWGGWHFPRHWTLYTKRTIGQLLNQSGFDVVQTNWLLSPNFWAQSFHHWMIDCGFSDRIAHLMDCSNPLAMAFFSLVDLVQMIFGHTSNMRAIGRKRQ